MNISMGEKIGVLLLQDKVRRLHQERITLTVVICYSCHECRTRTGRCECSHVVPALNIFLVVISPGSSRIHRLRF